MRISFDAMVPRTGAYSISAATLSSASGKMLWPLQFGHMSGLAVQPPPTNRNDSPHQVFQKDITYRFTQDMLPNFLEYDERQRSRRAWPK